MRLVPFTADIRQQLINTGYSYIVPQLQFQDPESDLDPVVTVKAVKDASKEEGICLHSEEVAALFNKTGCYVMIP